jgi:hypothetical protein
MRFWLHDRSVEWTISGSLRIPCGGTFATYKSWSA